MKRIGALLRQITKKKDKGFPEGLTPKQTLKLCRKELNQQHQILTSLLQTTLRPALADAGIPILNFSDLTDDQKNEIHTYFIRSVEPILTPLSVDAAHPFPFISGLGLNIALLVQDKKKQQPRFVRIKVPTNRPRWVALANGGVIPLEQVIIANIEFLIPTAKQISCYLFRVIRGAKDDPWDRLTPAEKSSDLSPGSLIGMVTAELTARKFAGITRLEIGSGMPKELQNK
jgi:polyphosphate kinase